MDSIDGPRLQVERSPLSAAAFMGASAAMVDALLEAGAPLHPLPLSSGGSEEDMTVFPLIPPIECAMQQRHISTVTLLLDRGAVWDDSYATAYGMSAALPLSRLLATDGAVAASVEVSAC